MTLILQNPNVTATVTGLPTLDTTEPLDPVINSGTLACFDCAVADSISQSLDPIPVATTWQNLAALEDGPARALIPTGEVDLMARTQIGRSPGQGIDFDQAGQHLEGIEGVRTYVAANPEKSYLFSYWFRLNSDVTNPSTEFSHIAGLGDANSAGNNLFLFSLDHADTNHLVASANGMMVRQVITAGSLVHVALAHHYPSGTGAAWINGVSVSPSPQQSAPFGNLEFGAPQWKFRLGRAAPISPAAWQISQQNAPTTAYRLTIEDLSVSGRSAADAVAGEREAVDGTVGATRPWFATA